MKKIGFIFCFIILASSVFVQQFLWSTTKDTLNKWEKYVQLEMVTSEVLSFYDLYQLYFDGSGFSKDGFIEFIKKFKEISEKDYLDDILFQIHINAEILAKKYLYFKISLIFLLIAVIPWGLLIYLMH